MPFLLDFEIFKTLQCILKHKAFEILRIQDNICNVHKFHYMFGNNKSENFVLNIVY